MKNITVKMDITLLQAMKILDKTAEKCLLVVDDNQQLLGTLTDGDIRRSILAGKSFTASIKDSYSTQPTVLLKGRYSNESAEELLRKKKLDLIPVVDQANIVIDYVTWEKLGMNDRPTGKLRDVQVVIMAGGRGSRLQPFTKVLPKPLVPIHDKTIIEHIIQRFLDNGCNDFHITVNYKSKIMKAYFEELNSEYSVHFIEESEPLGTAGSLRFLNGKFNQPFFVTNCDIIINADYCSLFDFHVKNGYDVTLVASTKEYIIPYGTCELNGDGHLSHINEKPKYDFLVNAGLYVVNPDVLDIIPENTFYHITHLIEEMIKRHRRVGVFPIDDDSWIDVGQWAEYKKAVERL